MIDENGNAVLAFSSLDEVDQSKDMKLLLLLPGASATCLITAKDWAFAVPEEWGCSSL